MWRCVDNIVGYCKEIPSWEKEPETVYGILNNKAENIIGGTCKLNYKTCGRYAIATELIKPLLKINPETKVEKSQNGNSKSKSKKQ